jgi:hypothetical protein
VRERTHDGGQADPLGAAKQEALRHQLGEAMLRLEAFSGEIPAPLGEAERAMRDAAQALGAGQPDQAVGAQTRAAEALAKSLNAAGQMMAQRLGGAAGLFVGAPGAVGRSGDIFGRPPGNGQRGFGTGEVAIPDRGEIRRAEEILRELRRRAGERSRPRPELDYIERLLRRF